MAVSEALARSENAARKKLSARPSAVTTMTSRIQSSP
jgi:hypothetical protein